MSVMLLVHKQRNKWVLRYWSTNNVTNERNVTGTQPTLLMSVVLLVQL